MQVADLLRDGERHRRAGRLAEAERAYRDALGLDRDHPLAQHALALLMKGRDDAEAERLMRQSLRRLPNEPSFHNNLANLLRARGEREEAEHCYRTALRLNPGYAEAHYNLGLVLKEKRPDEAIECFRRAAALQSGYAEPLTQIGVVLKNLGRPTEAVPWLQQAAAANPRAMDAHYYLGIVTENLGGDAAEHFARAVLLKPDSIEALRALCNALRKSDRIAEAVGVAQRWLAVAPEMAEPSAVLGDLLLRAGDAEAARPLVERALARERDNVAYLILVARVRIEEGRAAEAAALLQRAAEIAPEDAAVKTHLANALKILGRLDEAVRQLRDAIARDSDNAEAYLELTDAVRLDEGDPLIARIEVARGRAEVNSEAYAALSFALGKAYDDCGDTDRAFACFAAGNGARRQRAPYDEAGTLAHFDRLAEAFTAELVAARSGYGSPSRLPIFLVGMPRCGSTLVEQILASHPDVVAGGEVTFLSRSITAFDEEHTSRAAFPLSLPEWTAEDFSTVAERYLAKLGRFADGKPRVTDKLLSNFLLVGFIHLALPGAKIVHCRRDPVDNCLSSYSKFFGIKMPHNYGLASLGRYYRKYHGLMEHWRRVLPAGAFLDIQYEDVVSDLEGQARRVLEFCGLPWNPACLDFHKTERPVRTASVAQVRQPLYGHAVRRWHRYRSHLGPLLEALGDLVPETASPRIG